MPRIISARSGVEASAITSTCARDTSPAANAPASSGNASSLRASFNGAAGLSGAHATTVTQRGRGGEEVVALPVARPGVLADRSQAKELDPIREPAHPLDVEYRFVGGQLVDRLLEIRQRIEHTTTITMG